MTGDVFLRLEGVSKSYGAVHALSDVNLEVGKGTIHAILGENGAGKSTLLKILSGVVMRDKGRILLDGAEIDPASPVDARHAGIVCVFQELSLVPHLTVAENVTLANPPRNAFGRIDRRRERRMCEEVFARIGSSHIDPDARVGDLPLARQQLIEIAKALVLEPRVLILDEATSALSAEEVRALFALLRQLKSDGITILFISHRMHEIDAIADHCSVFRNGRHIETFKSGTRSDDERIRLMIGRDISQIYPEKPAPEQTTPLLTVRGFCWGNRLRDIDLDIGRGEIVGLGGLDGQGQSELLLGLFGLLKGVTGDVLMGGEQYRLRPPIHAKRPDAGLALIPEDRKTEGLFLDLSIRDNIAISSLANHSRVGFVDGASLAAMIDDQLRKLEIKFSDIDLPVSTMSGGNQQKVVLAKWLATSPRLLLLNDPTRGVDIGTKQQIYHLFRKLAAEGLAILFYSTDYDELIGLCDRVHVLYGGSIRSTLQGDDLTEENVLGAALGKAVSTGPAAHVPERISADV